MAPDVTGVYRREAHRNVHKYQPRAPRGSLHKESERLKTFRNWSVSFIDPKLLAKLGLFYTGTSDVVECAFCDVQIGLWEEGDDPDADHRASRPTCPFVRGEDCGNEPIPEGGDVEQAEEAADYERPSMVTASQDVCGNSGFDIRSGPERPGKIPLSIEASNLWKNFEVLGVSKVSGPVSPHYATYNARLKTFETWKHHEIQPPEKLAEAGFYYILQNDNVLCFHCGGGLTNWEVEDDPWVEHARWFSRCGFVILKKGRAFIEGIQARDKLEAEGKRESESASGSRESESREQAKPEAEKKSESPSAEKNVKVAVPTTETSEPSSSSSDRESQPSPITEAKEIALCRICYVKERGIVFLPCGHFVSCTDCAPSLSMCAVCRKPFEATVRAYLS